MVRRKNKKSFPAVLLLFFISLFLFPEFSAAAEHSKKILFISSYSYDWGTVPRQLNGFNSRITNSAAVYYVFMDTKKFTPAEAEDFMIRHMTMLEKYGPYDAVAAGDDAALMFITNHRNQFFKDIPVIFFGIDSSDLAHRAYTMGGMTGTIETHYDTENILLALKFIPKAKQIFVITDDTVAGIASRTEFIKAAVTCTKLPITYINTSILTKSQLISTLESLGKDSILLYLNFTVDSSGNYYPSQAGTALVTEYSSVPFFSAIATPDKSTAGAVVDYTLMGAVAADNVNRILSGIKPEEIKPFIIPASVKVNYRNMKKFGLTVPSDLKGKAEIIDMPVPFLTAHYIQILITSFCIIILLLLFIVIRYISGAKRQQLLIAELTQAKNAQETFLSRMSHDMRTPMNAILGLAGFGMEEKEHEKSVSYFKQIISSGSYLMRLLNDLLDMNKLESGTTVLTPESVRTDEISNDILTIIKPRAIEKKLKLVTDFSEEKVRTVYVDRQRVEQVLINILNNAVKYTPQNGTVTWKTTNSTDQNGLYCIHTISDTGVGMSTEFQKKLFTPFSQENNPLSRAEGGSGLGLAISKNLVELMDGSISCISEQGKGTTFTVIIPLPSVPESVSDAGIPADEHRPDISCLKNRRILICEDNEINMMIEKKLLEDKGCITDEAENGEKAVQKAQNNTYDLILMDIRMPVMDGLEAARRIRRFDSTTPIIAMSANAYPEDIKQSLDAGMNEHLTKPVDKEKLLDSAARFCSASGPFNLHQ